MSPKTAQDVAFSTSGLAGRPSHPMRLEIDVLVDAAFHAAMIFAASLSSSTRRHAVPTCAEQSCGYLRYHNYTCAICGYLRRETQHHAACGHMSTVRDWHG